MDTTILVDTLYDKGKKLIEELDKKGLKFPIALWVNDPERDDWRLVFGITKLNLSGSKEIFKNIHQVILKHHIELSLNNITLEDYSSPFCQSLKHFIKTGLGLGKLTFTGNYINGQRFPDSIIYRVS